MSRQLGCIMTVLAGCSAYSVKPSAPTIAAFGPAQPELGTVCVIRRSMFAQAVTFAIHDNGQLVGATRGDSYFCYLAEPGPHELVSHTGDSTDHPGYARFMVFAGQRYWLEQDHENNFGSVTSKLGWLDEAQARDKIADCEYKIVVEAGHEAVPPAVPVATLRE